MHRLPDSIRDAPHESTSIESSKREPVKKYLPSGQVRGHIKRMRSIA
jgi:hypothetical protein